MTFFPLDDSPGFWLYRAYVEGGNLFRKMLQAAGLDLTAEQCGVLVRLRELEGTNQSQLGKRLFKDRHNITRILNLLQARGLIERRPDESDRRIFRIFLTESGRALAEKMAPLITAYLDHVLNGLTDVDIRAMRNTLDRIIRNIEGRQ